MKRRLISVCLVLGMCFSLFSGTIVLAEDAVSSDVWDGTTSEPYGGGTGTEEDPYLIENGAQLYYLSLQAANNDEATSGKYYQLTNDVDLGDIRFEPINYFKGTFDGCDYVITGLKIESTGDDYAALISYGLGCTIKNLTLEGVVSGESKAAAFIAYGTCTLENLKNYCIVNGGNETGAFAGYVSSFNAVNITNYAVINGATYTGGLVGKLVGNGNLLNSANHGDISGSDYTAGVVGFADLTAGSFSPKTMTISACVNTGAVTGLKNIGGIVGYAESCGYYNGSSYLPNTFDSDIFIKECVNSGSVAGISFVSGLIGKSIIYTRHGEISVSDCYNMGSISAESEAYGLTYGEGTSYTLSTGKEYVYPKAVCCYNVGRVVVSSESAGTSDTVSQECAVKNVYYLEGVNPEATNPSAAVGNEETTMRIAAGYAGFDFTDTWTWDSDGKYNYPVLQSLGVIIIPDEGSGGDTEDEYIDLTTFELKWVGASLTLTDNIAINYRAAVTAPEGIAAEDYEVGALFWLSEPENYTINNAPDANILQSGDNYRTDGDYHVFTYDDIAAKEMNDTLYSVVYVKIQGRYIYSAPVEYSVAKFGMTVANGNYSEEFKTLAVDMLNYGAQAQVYFDHNTGNLANAELTEEQLAFGTQGDVELTNSQKFYGSSNSAVAFSSASLTLENAVWLNYKASIDESSTIDAVELIYDDSFTDLSDWESRRDTLTVVTMEDTGTLWSGSVENIAAKDLRNDVYAQIKVTYADGSVAYSNVLQYSVASFAYAAQQYGSDELAALTQSLLKYGDSAKAYFLTMN